MTQAAKNDTSPERGQSIFNWVDFLKTLSREELEKIILAMTPSCPEIVENYRMTRLPNDDNAILAELEYKVDLLVDLADDYLTAEEEHYEYWEPNEEGEELADEMAEGCEQLQGAFDKLISQGKLSLVLDVCLYGIDLMRERDGLEYIAPADLLEFLLKNFIRSSSGGEVEKIVACLFDWEENSAHSFETIEKQWCDFPEPVRDLWYSQALAKWKKLPAIKMSAQHQYYNGRRHKMERRLVSMAREKGDDALVLQILEKNLEWSDHVKDLYAEYLRQGKNDNLLPLMQQAQKIYPDDAGIREGLAKTMQTLNMQEEIMHFAWEDFIRTPLYSDKIDFLLEHAKQQNKEHEYLHKVLERLAKEEVDHPTKKLVYRSRRIELMLDYKMSDGAWEIGAKAKLDEGLRRRLAQARAKTHPLQAIAVYRAMLDEALCYTGGRAYHHVLSLLHEYRWIMVNAKKEEEFKCYLDDLRKEYKRRRIFITLLDGAKLTSQSGQ